MTDHTPTRRRLDGERVAHLAYTLALPGRPERWHTYCGRVHPKGAMRSAEGCTLCPDCRPYYERTSRYADAVSLVEQPESTRD